MKRVIVTGASGLIGKEVLPALRNRGYEVLPIRSAQTNLLTDPLPFQATHLLHLAWVTTPGLYWQDPSNLPWLYKSLSHIEQFFQTGGTRVVTIGTCAEYAWDSPLLSEFTTPTRPRTLYGAAKLSLGLLTEALARRYKRSSAHARLFYLYGADESPQRLVGGALQAFRDKRPFPTTNGLQKRDYLPVAQVAEALAALLDSAVEGPCNIGAGASISIRDLLLQIAAPLQASHLIHWGAKERPSDDPDDLIADIHRLTREVGWQPVSRSI